MVLLFWKPIMAQKSTVLTFEFQKKNVTYSGEYKDTVTFTVSVG